MRIKRKDVFYENPSLCLHGSSFNHLSGEDQEQIDRLVSHRHFHKGETIWQPGNDPLLIIVARGTLKVYMISSNGREQLLRILNPGDYEGVNTLLGAMAQDIFIDSITDTEVCLLKKKGFHRTSEQDTSAGT